MKTRFLVRMTPVLCLVLVNCAVHPPRVPVAGTPNWRPDPDRFTLLTDEDTHGNGIEVGEPKIYDDASLRMMVDAARAKLAGISGFDQSSLIKGLGQISGATISQTQFGVQVTGPSTPQVATTANGATNQVATTTGSTPGVVTTTTDPNQSVVTTAGAAVPPAAPTVPSGLAFTPPALGTPSSLDLLNEQMQLTYELANLGLLLEGSLSDRFVKNQRFVKPKTTIGFPITLRPPKQYKRAVAVVEVEVETAKGKSLAAEAPAVTALLPREKTYNVAAMTDTTTSVGGGMLVGAIGVSASWLRGHKTLYLVQDQDTIALQSPPDPDHNNAVRFSWEFRPVLGQDYVRGGAKQTFVQLAMPTLDALDCFGTIRVRTYWREFDQKRGLSLGVIPGSVLVASSRGSIKNFSIAHYNLAPSIGAVTYQDLGDGTVLVTVTGGTSSAGFLAGTYVQLGPTKFEIGKGLVIEDVGLKFVTPAAALAKWTGTVVARSGDNSELLVPNAQKTLDSLAQTACSGGPSKETARQELCRNGQITAVTAAAGPLSENDSELTVNVQFDGKQTEFARPELLLEIGGKVFGLRDAPVRREGQDIKLVVPTSLLVSNPRVHVFVPFWSRMDDAGGLKCFSKTADIGGFGFSSATERLVLISVDKDGLATYLLYGNGLTKATVKLPLSGATLAPFDHVATDRIQMLTVTKEAMAANKKVVLQKADQQRPIVLDLPQPDPKGGSSDPKVTVDSPVIQNTDQLDVSVDRVKDLVSIKLADKILKYTPGDSKIRLLNLKADGVTGEQKIVKLTFEFKGGTKVTLQFDVVAARIGITQYTPIPAAPSPND